MIALIMMQHCQPIHITADLAEKLSVYVRTLHSYSGMLDDMSIPIYAEAGPYGGFSRVCGDKLPSLVFLPKEATAINLSICLVS